MKAPQKTLSNLLGHLRSPSGSKGKAEALVITDPALSAIAERWRTASVAEKNASSAKELAATELAEPLRRAWLGRNAGSNTPTNSLEVPSPAGPVLASFSSQWDIPDPDTEAQVMARIPENLRRQAFTLRIDISAVPEENQHAFAKGVLALAAKHGGENAVKIGGGIRPVPTFNEQRHALFSAAENLELENLGLHTRLMFRAR